MANETFAPTDPTTGGGLPGNPTGGSFATAIPPSDALPALPAGDDQSDFETANDESLLDAEAPMEGDGAGLFASPQKNQDQRVRFSAADFDKVMPREDKLPQTRLNRLSASARRSSLAFVTAASSHPHTLDDDDDEEITGANEVLARADNCIREFQAAIKDLIRFGVDAETLDEDLAEKLDQFDEAHPDKLPWTALTDKGKKIWKTGGVISMETFKKNFKQDTKALWNEFRAIGLYNLATRASLSDFMTILQRTNSDLSALEQWATTLSDLSADLHKALVREQKDQAGARYTTQQYEDLQNRFNEVCDENEEMKQQLDSTVTERDALQVVLRERTRERDGVSENLTATLARNQAQEATISTLQKELSSRPRDQTQQATIEALQKEIATLREKVNRGPATQWNNWGPDFNASTLGAPGAPSSFIDLSGDLQPRVQRSAKAESPPVWYGEKSKDTVAFKVWLRKLQNKMEMNADHYPGDRGKVMAIESFLGGQAANTAGAFLDTSHPEYISTPDQFIQWLTDEYGDPNEKQKAKIEWIELIMKKNDTFTDFKNEFVRKAGARQLPRGEWKSEMHDKMALVPRLRNSLFEKARDDNVTFKDYCDAAQQIDYDQQRTEMLRKQHEKSTGNTSGTTGARGGNRNNSGGGASNRTGGSTGGNTGGGTRSNTGSSAGGASFGNAINRAKQSGLSKEEVLDLARKGACFRCKKTGHMSHECPDNPNRTSNDAERDARRKAQIARIEELYGGTQSNSEKLDNQLNDSGGSGNA